MEGSGGGGWQRTEVKRDRCGNKGQEWVGESRNGGRYENKGSVMIFTHKLKLSGIGKIDERLYKRERDGEGGVCREQR